MNRHKATTWIANNKAKAILLALAALVCVWDWFAVPRLFMALLLPFVVLSIPLLLLGIPFAVVWMSVKRHKAHQRGQTLFQPTEQGQGVFALDYPQAAPHAPAQALTGDQLMELYERHPERFDGLDIEPDFYR